MEITETLCHTAMQPISRSVWHFTSHKVNNQEFTSPNFQFVVRKISSAIKFQKKHECISCLVKVRNRRDVNSNHMVHVNKTFANKDLWTFVCSFYFALMEFYRRLKFWFGNIIRIRWQDCTSMGRAENIYHSLL